MGETALVHVANLSRNVRQGHLEEIFGFYGSVMRVHLPVDPRVGLPRGFGYVQYATPEDADEACKSLHGGKLDGNVMQVTLSYDVIPEEVSGRGERAIPPRDDSREERRDRSRSRERKGGRGGGGGGGGGGRR